uniref:Cytoskeleton associated protein 2 like n=1 Tax=Sciurus vulgaris TaxID=55149 RepID=A0A8D2AX25_SCIVU
QIRDEERQRKLQEYLAAKGKLKSQNTKPYLKATNNCLNPPPSKSTIGPQRHVTKHAVFPDTATRPISTKPLPRPANIREFQKPKLEPPNLGRRLTSKCVSSNPNCKPSSKSHQQHKAGSSTAGDLPRKPTRSPNTQEQQVTGQGIVPHTDLVDGPHVGNESVGGFLKEMDKENLSHALSEPEKMPDPELCTISKPEINTHNQTKSRLTSQQVLGKSLVTSAVLKDRVNKQFVRKPHIHTVPLKSQQLSKRKDLAKPGEKPPRTAPPPLVQTLGRTPASKKPAAKDIRSVKAERGKHTRSCSVAGQEAKRANPRTYPSWHQGELNHRRPSTKQDRKSMQPCSRPQTSCGLQNTRAVGQKPNVATGRCNSVVPSTPSIGANGTKDNKHKNVQQNAHMGDSRLKTTLPQSHFLNKTAPRTQAEVTATNGRGVPRGAQTNPNTKRKATAEDRRKQLEEWQKSKGKIYKRPPMELKTKRKIIEEMNISFWKSIEKEEEEKRAQWELSSKINRTLTGCLRLIEEGVPSSEILTILSGIPEAEKFAKFWICKAKLLASQGTFDVIGLYEEAIRSGATPIQELREVVLNILQESSRTTEGMSSDALVAETNITSVEEQANKTDPGHSCPPAEERDQATATPPKAKAEQHSHAGIKLQVAPVPRINGMPEVQDMKLITPVRRSARIERAASRYPEMLQEHDVVVASLDELLDVGDTECFMFRKNEALPMSAFEMLDL